MTSYNIVIRYWPYEKYIVISLRLRVKVKRVNLGLNSLQENSIEFLV